MYYILYLNHDSSNKRNIRIRLKDVLLLNISIEGLEMSSWNVRVDCAKHDISALHPISLKNFK